MSEKDRELMERYIYEVTRKVSKDQREEIAMELRELIEDMAEEKEMLQVLQALGDPAIFARKYQDDNRYLIGPEYYDDYAWVMEIVLFAVLLSALVSSIVQGITGETWLGVNIKATVDNVIDAAANVLSNLIVNAITSTIGSFGCVTLIFAVLQRMKVKVELKKKKVWSVKDLETEDSAVKPTWSPEHMAPVPNKKSRISRGDCIASIVFTMVVAGLFIFAPQIFGAYSFEENQPVKFIPLFNLSYWNVLLPLLLCSLFVGLAEDIIKLSQGVYSNVVLAASLISGFLQILLAIVILKILPFWNTSFMSDVTDTFGRAVTSRGDILFYWGTDTFANIFLAFILIVICINAVITIYKCLRYGIDKAEKNKL